MIIHQPTISLSSGNVTVSARVEFNTSGIEAPKILWFTFPERYEHGITEQGDGFLASLILSAMYFGEYLEIRSPVSPLIAYNIPKLIRSFSYNYPSIFSPIDVKFNSLKTISHIKSPAGGAAPFSGGIDSTYTLFHHAGQTNIPEELKLTHGIFIHGFDILLHEVDFYQFALEQYKPLFEKLGIDLIPGATNCYSFYQYRMDWSIAYMPPLVGFGLILQKMFRRMLISNGKSIKDKNCFSLITNEISGTQNLRSDTCDILLFDNTIIRIEKTKKIKDWPEIHTTLRVCPKRNYRLGFLNCGRCPKCTVTMIYLELMGSFENYKTFAAPFSLFQIFRMALFGRDAFIRADSLMKLALQKKRFDIFFTFCLVYIPGKIILRLNDVFIRFMGLIPDSVKYNLKKRLFPRNEEV